MSWLDFKGGLVFDAIYNFTSILQKDYHLSVYATPGTPGKTLGKNTGPMVELDAYRSIVGKISY
jgi:hypothetical protein